MPILVIHSHKDVDISLSNSLKLFQEIINSRQTKNRNEPTVMTFAREGTLYLQPDAKTWYIQALYAAHGWEFIGEKVREFLETFCNFKIEEIKNDSSDIRLSSDLINISSNDDARGSKSKTPRDKLYDSESENNEKNDNGNNGGTNSDTEKKEWIVVS